MTPERPAPVAFVLKGYPRLSETFIAQEILALEQRGLPIEIWSLRHPTDRERHPITDEIQAKVRCLPEYLYQEPERVRTAWRAAAALPGWDRAIDLFTRDFHRDPTTNRVRRFGQAAVLAAELSPDIHRLHAHFLHTPASVTRYAALMRDQPWSVSAHAKDIWTSPEWELREKLADCAFAVTCTSANADYLGGLAPTGRVERVYHGLDLSRFPTPGDRAPNNLPVILSVGRAVPKKGYPVLLQALSHLRDRDWRMVHIGGGPDLPALQSQAVALGIDTRIEWLGARPQAAVLQALRQADIFVLASRITDDGDRDGLPNVLVEAQSQRLPVVATAVSAIPELIRDGVNGLLVPPDDDMALSGAIARLLDSPVERQAFGDAGEQRVRGQFDLDRCITRLAEKFGVPA